MALKTEKPPEVSPVPVPTTVLELALYKKYTWQNVTYEEGKPYRFRNAEAMVLLSEQDTGRPVWRLWHPKPAREAPKNEIVDATSVHAPPPIFDDPIHGLETPKKRIDIGDDSEIQDILGGDVTV